jgi:hypothetical protein
VSIGVPHVNPDGHRIMVDADTLDIGRRLREGDGTVGWAGDPGLTLSFDERIQHFVVTRYDPYTGRELDVTYWAPPLTTGLLIRLREADTHRAGNDPVARMIAADEAYEADEAERFAGQTREVAERLVHALRKDGMDIPGSRLVVAMP